MGKINVGRLIVGGLIAGVIMNVVEGVTNGAVLGQQWKDWAAKVAPVTDPPTPSQAMLFWTILGFALGLVAVWMYAAVRPRLGAGPKTAIIVGFVLWIIYWPLVALQHGALGTVPSGLLVMGSIGGLVAALGGTLAGAAIYKE
jgi:hypothetical protein